MSRGPNDPPLWRWLPRLPLLVLAVLGAVMLYQGIDGVLEFNDFQVFWRAAEAALARDTALYAVTADDGRPFIYPPPSALLLGPLALLPERVSGIAWALAKLVLLGATLRVALRWAQREGVVALGRGPWAAAVAAACLYEPLRSDFSHGQINVVLLAVAVLAADRVFSGERRGPDAGAAWLALAALTKVTPGLYAGLLILHRRWRALAVFGFFVVAIAIVSTVWFGSDIWSAWRARSDSWIAGHPLDKYIRSLVELATLWLRRSDIVLGAGASRVAWLAEILALGLLHLGLRAVRDRVGRPPTPLWDLAALSIGVVLVTPMARLAQEVAALPALLLIALHLLDRGTQTQRRIDAADALGAASLLLFALGRSLPLDALTAIDATPLAALLAAYASLLALPAVQTAPSAFEVARRVPPNK